MSEKRKKVYRVINYFEHCLIFVSAVSSCVSISELVLLAGVPVGIASSAVRLKICALTIEVKKLIIKKKGEEHDKIVLLAKIKLNAIENLIYTALLDSFINNDEF